jgi:hypothetical protein
MWEKKARKRSVVKESISYIVVAAAAAKDVKPDRQQRLHFCTVAP